MERIEYDEFGYFHENAAEFGLPYGAPPTVRRDAVELADGRSLSALVWGAGEPELVLLHGGAQNAHTWDTVALALDRPLVAIDLPGHGHSDGAGTQDPPLVGAAADVATVVASLAPRAAAVVGMSLGGLTALTLTTVRPDLVRRLVLVDVLPDPDPTAVGRITDFVAGPETFDSFDEILARTVQFNPTRSVSSLRRGILHNAVQLADGRWQWRHRRHDRRTADAESAQRFMSELWEALSVLSVPMMLVRGMAEGSVVTDAAEAELCRRVPGARVEHVEGAGHSVQGDRPVELARLIAGFVPSPSG